MMRKIQWDQVMAGAVGGFLATMLTAGLIQQQNKNEIRRDNAFAKYAQVVDYSERRIEGSVQNYFYDGKKLVISGKEGQNVFSLAVLDDKSGKMDSLAGLLMNTSATHRVSFPLGNVDGNWRSDKFFKEYGQFGGYPHYTNETPSYVSGVTKEVIRNAGRVEIDSGL
jgi:hypothetical protein